MDANITTGATVTCQDGMGHSIGGIVVEVMPGACRGGGIALIKAVWPGRKRASLRYIELEDVAVAA